MHSVRSLKMHMLLLTALCICVGVIIYVWLDMQDYKLISLLTLHCIQL